MKAHFDSTAEEVSSIPASELGEGWKRASLLTESSIAKFRVATEEDVYAKYGFHLEIDSDLDADATEERIGVGVYETQAGASGRFILVLGRKSTGEWESKFVSFVPGYHNFSALLLTDGAIRWYSCMMCGDFETLRWRDNSYFLE